MEHEPLVKYSHPTMFDKDATGTIRRCINDNKESEFYIQVSPQQDTPQWERMGSLLEKAFEDFYSNEQFIAECLRLYRIQQEQPLITITKIIQEKHPKAY